MIQKIYLVKSLLRFHDDEEPTRDMRKRAQVLWATSTREEAAQDVRDHVEEAKRNPNDLYKKYYFIEETDLFIALSKD